MAKGTLFRMKREFHLEENFSRAFYMVWMEDKICNGLIFCGESNSHLFYPFDVRKISGMEESSISSQTNPFTTPVKSKTLSDAGGAPLAITEKEISPLELLYSSKSSVPLHSQYKATVFHDDLEGYYVSLYEQVVPSSECKKYWIEAHYYSALRHLSLHSTPLQTKMDFSWKTGNKHESDVSSFCSVNQALGLAVQQQNNQKQSSKRQPPSIMILKSCSISKTTATSGLFSLTSAFSNLSLTPAKNKQSQSCFGPEDDQMRMEKASIYIGEILSKRFHSASSKTSTIGQTPSKSSAPSSTAYESITSTPRKIASALARGITGGITSMLASYDIVEDPSYYSVNNNGDSTTALTEYAEYERDLQEKEMQLLELKQLNPLADDEDVLNITLAVDCCVLLRRFIYSFSQQHDSNPDRNDEFQSIFILLKDKVMISYHDKMDQNASGTSWTKFCRYVGRHYQALSSTASNLLPKQWNWKTQAHARLLSQITPTDANLLASSLLSISIIYSNPEQTILFFPITPSSPLELSQLDVALFDLTSTQQSLLNRIHQITLEIEKTKEKAIYYHKKNKNPKLAMIQLQKRKMKQEQLDRYTNTLLNIEMALESIHRSVSDLELKQTMEQCRDAMKLMRETQECNVEHVEEMMDDLKEEMEGLHMVGEALSQDVTGVNLDDLEMELNQLEMEMTKQENGGDDNKGNHGKIRPEVDKEIKISSGKTSQHQSEAKSKENKVPNKSSRMAVTSV